jgi:hypothetical protein
VHAPPGSATTGEREVSGVGSGWTNLVAVGVGLVFLYNAAQGTARLGRLDDDGVFIEVGSPVPRMASTFTHVTGSLHGGLLLLDAVAGVGVTGHVDANGFEQSNEITNMPTESTACVAVNCNAIFFYDATTGVGSMALLDATGAFVEVGAVSAGLPTGSDDVVGAPSGALFFLKSADATGAAWHVDEFGEPRAIEELRGFAPWTHVAAG